MLSVLSMLSASRWPSFKLVFVGFLLGALFGICSAQALQPTLTAAKTTILVADLPGSGAKTYALILQGGPFAHEKDGVIFGNRERLLPLHTRGYYREYTVMLPGSRKRGTHRIVCGGPARTPDSCYYTADHYASFRKIVP